MAEKQGHYSHIEIPADDLDRATGFYRGVFGWTFTSIPGFDDYNLYKTPAGDGSVGGGIGKRGTTAGHKIRNYVNVDSVDATIPNVTKHGGKVVQPKEQVMGQGWYAIVADSEGNEFAIWEDDPAARRS
jgi:predicted enzyme related to lactoylglutathione lyase